jgi:protein required for attachment to host cells
MSKLQIPHDAFVFVGDGRKALFLRNDGDEKFPNLKAERVFVDENPPTREQGTDRPGRVFKRAGTNVRSGVETTDWHDLEEHRFAQRVAAAMEKLVRQRKVKTLVIVAPPRALADLRHAIHADVKSRIIAEIGKDPLSILLTRSRSISWGEWAGLIKAKSFRSWQGPPV